MALGIRCGKANCENESDSQNLSWRVSFDSVEGRGEGGFEYQAMRHRRRNGGQKELLQHRPLSNRRLSGLVRSPAFGSIGDHPLNI